MPPGRLGTPRRSRGAPLAPRFRFFAGKGGVGKTTCAAAAAVGAAERGRRVLLVSTDPAHSLRDVLLSVDPGSGPTPPAPRHGAGSIIPTARGTLEAVELDADRALGRWLTARRRRFRTLLGRATYLDDDDIDRFLGLSLPGVDELIGLLELDRMARARPYDEVVVDTAPTGHTLRLLAMPETLGRLAAVLDGMQDKHRFLTESLGGAVRRDAADALVAEIAAQSERLGTLLRDPSRCAFTWILLPETLALDESRDGLAALEAAGIPVAEVLVNRVMPPPPGPCTLCRARRDAETAVVAATAPTFPGRTMRVLPALEAEPRGLPALRRLAALLRNAPELESGGRAPRLARAAT
ncbi:MAG: ArsA family ATPase, partial [Candidatus Rokuibacteriota bacterium]